MGTQTDAQKANSQTAQATEQRTGPPQGQQTAAERETSGGKMSIDPGFKGKLDQWDYDGRPEGARFILGSTGDVLQGLGAMEADIFMEGDKISTILEDHPEMTLEEIKRVPEILDDPVLVMKSRNAGRGGRQNTRLVMFGSIKAQDGNPVMCVLDLRPMAGDFVIADMQKVSSAYTKDNDPVGFIQRSDVLHADKRRTTPLLRTVGFQVPIELQRSGSMGSISYNGQNVNIQGVPFEKVVRSGNDKGKFSMERISKEATLEDMKAHLQELNNERYQAFRVIQDFRTSDAYNDIMDRINNADNDSLDALVKEMEEMEKSLGIQEANKRYGDLTGEIKELSAQIEVRRKEDRKAAIAKAREQYTASFAKEYANAAEDMFGTTDDFSLAGYLDTNGELLDFSQGQGQRTQDHREIADVLDFLPEEYDYSDPLIEFMNLGNIRIMSSGVDLAVEPNAAQREQLMRFFEEHNGEVFVDFSDEDGRSVGTLEYGAWTKAERILHDIDEYFRTGEVPSKSELSKFHGEFSRESSDYIQELRELQKQNETLKKRLDYWMGQTRLSGGPTVDHTAVLDEARQIIRDMGIRGMTIDETAQRLPRSSSFLLTLSNERAIIKQRF